MLITLTLNGESRNFEARPDESLLRVLRRNGLFGVKHGCESGECGACAVLLDGRPVASCLVPAAQAHGHSVATIESIGKRANLHPIQQAFAETGAIQCGYCTPAMVLAARALLDVNGSPTEDEVREALSGVLCRCTGYVKPVQAVMLAAARMRGESPAPPSPCFKKLEPSFEEFSGISPQPEFDEPADGGGIGTAVQTRVVPCVTSSSAERRVVGKPEIKVDAIKLALGKPAFADDVEMRGMLYA